jgi:hypothetical protein
MSRSKDFIWASMSLSWAEDGEGNEKMTRKKRDIKLAVFIGGHSSKVMCYTIARQT